MLFQFNDWTFKSSQGLLMTSGELDAMALRIPPPTIPFNSSVELSFSDRKVFSVTTSDLLGSVNDRESKNIVYTKGAIKVVNPYDWTYRPSWIRSFVMGIPNQGDPSQFEDPRLSDAARFAILHYAHVDFYEDELGERGGGESKCEWKVRVMEWGFLSLLRFDYHLGEDSLREELRFLHFFCSDDRKTITLEYRVDAQEKIYKSICL